MINWNRWIFLTQTKQSGGEKFYMNHYFTVADG